ncbi:fatty acid desaturase [Reichenbachiella carrageenanivorans]|uniref:Fatty acid desaturase n=1 Tax=Reichenbachiella carrageenanivorans TaxID=2979869 RepID=A0ABY6D519_9BACT|nr:fatty acid desaturase [Reichenbachiella carrageenanivorans]UXX80994.1 fatty acid desaturase [Reichenbachiella carrageenanivorans]
MSTKIMTERDYSLLGPEAQKAVANGLAEATWYHCPVSRADMRQLLERKDLPAVIDTLIWFGLILGSATLFAVWWPYWYAIIPYLIYCALYAGSSDSRWHESSHGTAFKSDWMNNVLYEIASFMVNRQSVPWRWSHTRHHSDTIIRGRDPEIAVPRPPDILGICLQFFALKSAPAEFKKIVKHALGKIDPTTATYLPKSAHQGVFLRARIYILIYSVSIALSFYLKTPIPFMLIILPTFLGTWLAVFYGLTQHAGLAENVLDHRLNCRTILMNKINRFFYWNMNYHLEHHMYPLVPYHALPKLHELIKKDCPPPYPSIISAYKEIIPTLFKQVKDPAYFVVRDIPAPSDGMGHQVDYQRSSFDMNETGWVKLGLTAEIGIGEVRRLDFEQQTFAIYHTKTGQFYASEGICTHGSTHLADGLVIGEEVECPKHNGRFLIKDGSPTRPPVCLALKTFPMKVDQHELYIDLTKALTKKTSLAYTVVSNENVSTYIKELVLAPANGQTISYAPGDFIHLEIPTGEWQLTPADLSASVIAAYPISLFGIKIKNEICSHRNYSLATNPTTGTELKFNVRLALPPIGSSHLPGIGSSYIFQLKTGDLVNIQGSHGDFHIRDTQSEMIYIGGGAGMAPLRSHISYLFETLKTNRKVSYWYGTRSLQDAFYLDYFEQMVDNHENFNFELVISEDTEGWVGAKGYVHETVQKKLKNHKNIGSIEFYLCGPPPMIAATQLMLAELGVAKSQILFDEF